MTPSKKLLKCTLLPVMASFAIGTAAAQNAAPVKYEANWDSINSRTTPEWWTDAKFGIFIHWGLYSVPAYSKVGKYSEWYWNTLENQRKRRKKGQTETVEFHDRVYGKDFTYPQFADMFRAELFDADEWAEVFKDAGAKYVVLTAKHHDGYCLWPSKEADQSWGRPWNSVNTGPKRDLVGDLTKAVRKTEVKMGLYLSVYEWFNPLWIGGDRSQYVDKVWVPQFKDLVNRYKPSTIFVDGEWDMPAEKWRSPELLSWLFNNAENKNEVVINDRWGKGSRHKNGGYYTTEFGAGLPNASHAWEENRGMGHSFGYSRAEKFKDYHSSQELLYMLIDIVSRGGNFLLDIGPTADGLIPPIMTERLIHLGDWLKVNGEAIYGTRTWVNTCQWTEGVAQDSKFGRHHRGKYDVMKVTVNPEEGMAVKEVFFTRKDKTLYAICPVFPTDTLTLKGIKAADKAKVTFLGTKGELKWTQKGDDLIITMPKVNPSTLPCNYAWTFKISEVK